MDATKTKKKSGARVWKGGPGHGDTPIVVGGGGGSRRTKAALYVYLKFEGGYYTPNAGNQGEHHHPGDRLGVLKVKGSAKDYRESNRIEINCYRDGEGYSTITIKVGTIGVRFDHDYFKLVGQDKEGRDIYRADGFYLDSITGRPTVPLYKYPGFGSINCELIAHNIKIERVSKSTGRRKR